MSQKEKFRKVLKENCPECDNKLKLIDFIDDEGDVSYVETYKLCDECGYSEDVTDKRNKNNKVEVA